MSEAEDLPVLDASDAEDVPVLDPSDDDGPPRPKPCAVVGAKGVHGSQGQELWRVPRGLWSPMIDVRQRQALADRPPLTRGRKQLCRREGAATVKVAPAAGMPGPPWRIPARPPGMASRQPCRAIAPRSRSAPHSTRPRPPAWRQSICSRPGLANTFVLHVSAPFCFRILAACSKGLLETTHAF